MVFSGVSGAPIRGGFLDRQGKREDCANLARHGRLDRFRSLAEEQLAIPELVDGPADLPKGGSYTRFRGCGAIGAGEVGTVTRTVEGAFPAPCRALDWTGPGNLTSWRRVLVDSPG